MKNFVIATLIAALTAPALAQAASTNGNFNVTINLTSTCLLSSISNLQYNYTSFAASATVTGGAFTLQCTNGLAAPTFTVKQGSGAAAASVTTTDSALNLAYTVTAPTGVAPDGTAKPYTIGGSMTANQSGTCNTSNAACTNGSANNNTYTLIVSY